MPKITARRYYSDEQLAIAPWLDSVLKPMAIASIRGYQKYLSPRKGFSCAHRLLYGGESCSQYVKQAIAEQGLLGAIRASQQRFQACKEANLILRSQKEESDQAQPKKKKSMDCWEAASAPNCEDLGECAGESCNCADSLSSCDIPAFDCSTPDCNIPSCELPHCGDCGSGLDCGGGDCGSCSW